jgi:two-component system sensor histidine kinase GlrK
MRLFSRLVLSHAAPVLVVTVPLALVLGAIGRMTQLARAIDEDELATLAREGSLHEADWHLDLSMRHAVGRCARGEEAEATEAIARNASLLRERIQTTAPVNDQLHRASVHYLDLADRLLAAGVCGEEAVRVEQERAELDARITTIWVERLADLHAAARAREASVDELGTFALVSGVIIAGIALVLALWIAHRMAAEISTPLQEIARVALRLARGDFREALRIEGPVEIVELAEELDRMRVRLAELEALKQGFLASVSHELRTPLSKIREALALLVDGACGPLQERQARVVEIARTACEREIRIVTTLLDLSRLRAGRPLQRRSGVSVDEILASAVREEEPDARARNVAITVDYEGETVRASLDEAMLERAIANLVRNAVSVSKPGQKVRIQRSLEERGGETFAVVRVRDEGPGVPADVRDSLFEPFVTAAVHSSPKGLGIGLGLALAREVARAHGGDLELEPEVDQGACFALRIPLDRRTATPARAPTEPASPAMEMTT